ncbi:hypothetical protein QZH41_000659 [Actinostola sp. cb2023]|nr:hypothetical protein QZH41_000659 [Actinostola sp. cb2023]
MYSVMGVTVVYHTACHYSTTIITHYSHYSTTIITHYSHYSITIITHYSHYQCWSKDEKCRRCGKVGHIQRACRAKMNHPEDRTKKEQGSRVHQFNIDENDKDEEDGRSLVGSLEVHEVKGSNDGIIWITPKVDKEVIKMELDTGSAVTALPAWKYKELWNDRPLKDTDVILRTYSGERIKPAGKATVQVEYGDQRKELELFVVETTGPPLFGRDWLHQIQLDWRVIKSLSKEPEHHSEKELQEILERHKEVFSNDLGTLKLTKARIDLKAGSQPKYCKARPIPYALIPKVEAELKHLEEQGILQRVTSSEWATPIVPVVKPNGDVRICGDFKTTVNPQLEPVQYPLPRIEDIFAKLAGGELFSKIDLRQAYHQMEVEESSKEYLTINTPKGLYRYNRLVFGVTSAPAIWQRAMDQVLDGVEGTSCMIDDIIVTGRNDQEHLKNLDEIQMARGNPIYNNNNQDNRGYMFARHGTPEQVTSNNSKGKEYEPGTLQTYRNGLRRYFLERPCPPAIDNFDLDKTGSAEFEEVATMLSLKKKDLKKKGLGNKPNAADPVEAEDLEKMWSSGAVGLQNPRSLIRLVWWNNVTHLGMRACKEQHDCQLEDFVVRDQYIEYTERQTKNRQGDEGKAKRARKYNNKLWKTDGGERDPYRAFMEYVSHRPKGDDVPNNFYLTPIDNTTSGVWYKSIPIGVNTLSKMMKQIADKAGLKGKFTNSSGRKTTVQLLRDEFHPLEISELTGHANPESITSYSHNPLEKQRQMSNTLSGFRNPSSSTVAVSVGQSSMPMPMAPQPQARDHAVPRFDSSGFLAGAVSGLFTEASFNNSPVNIAINLHASVNPSS